MVSSVQASQKRIEKILSQEKIVQLAEIADVILPDQERANQIVSTFDRIVKLQSEIEMLREEQESLIYSYWHI